MRVPPLRLRFGFTIAIGLLNRAVREHVVEVGVELRPVLAGSECLRGEASCHDLYPNTEMLGTDHGEPSSAAALGVRGSWLVDVARDRVGSQRGFGACAAVVAGKHREVGIAELGQVGVASPGALGARVGPMRYQVAAHGFILS